MVMGVLFVTGLVSLAEVRLPAIIGSGMVLQRNACVPIWGFADTGELVTVRFAGQVKTAAADERGRWRVTLDPMEASSESRDMVVSGKNEIRIDNILVGEVWLASGQSNMEFSIVSLPEDEKKLVASWREDALLRMFCIPWRIASTIPLDDTVGGWSTCDEIVDAMLEGKIEPYEKYSAVGFFFGLKLRQELGVPVAVIDSSWGGTEIERWIADEGWELTGLDYRRVPEEAYPDVFNHQKKVIDMVREWVPMAEAAMKQGKILPLRGEARMLGRTTNDIYNGMIHPLIPFGIKGVLWYQGESDRGRDDYFTLLKALIGGWRSVFGADDLPFYLVQIAPFDYSRGRDTVPSELLADSIWSAQYRAAEEIDGCEIIAIHDTIEGNVHDIHPPRKKRVGYRLAAMALDKAYGTATVSSGPRFQFAERDGSEVVVRFSGITDGLETADGQTPDCFEIAGKDRRFMPALTEIREDNVRARSPDVTDPEYIRMGWSDTAAPNLRDKSGWPVFAFPLQPIRPSLPSQ